MVYANEGPSLENPSTPPQPTSRELIVAAGSQDEHPAGESFLDEFSADQPERTYREQIQDNLVLNALKWTFPAILMMSVVFGLTVRASESLSFWQRIAITAGITAASLVLVLFVRRRIRTRRVRTRAFQPSRQSPTIDTEATSSKITREAESYIASGRQNIGQILDPIAITVINTSGVIYVYSQRNVVLEIAVIGVCLVPQLLAVSARIKSTEDFRWRYPLLLGAALALAGIYAPAVTGRVLGWIGDRIFTAASYLLMDTLRVMLFVWATGLIFTMLRIIEWWYGLIYVTPSKVILRRGVIFPRYPSMERRHMSDSEPKQGLLERIFGCWKLILESTGQKQSLNRLYWVPRKLLPPMGFSEYGDPHIKL